MACTLIARTTHTHTAHSHGTPCGCGACPDMCLSVAPVAPVCRNRRTRAWLVCGTDSFVGVCSARVWCGVVWRGVVWRAWWYGMAWCGGVWRAAAVRCGVWGVCAQTGFTVEGSGEADTAEEEERKIEEFVAYINVGGCMVACARVVWVWVWVCVCVCVVCVCVVLHVSAGWGLPCCSAVAHSSE